VHSHGDGVGPHGRGHAAGLGIGAEDRSRFKVR
jgi:hypothetical protein